MKQVDFDVTAELFEQIISTYEVRVEYEPEKFELAEKRIRAYKQLFNFSKTLLLENHELIEEDVLKTFESTMNLGLKKRFDSNNVHDQLLKLIDSMVNVLKNNTIETLNK